MKWLLILLCAMSAKAVEIGIDRQGECIEVYTINNTLRCLYFQWKTDLSNTNWIDYHGYICGQSQLPAPRVFFTLDTVGDRTFWRARECDCQ